MMEIDVKQRNQRIRRRVRAQRMQAERDRDVVDGGDPDSAEEEQIAAREKPARPPLRRKKPKEPAPLLEEDIIDGFAILAFKSYEDLEYAIKIANKRNEKRLSAITELTALASVDEKPPKIDTGQRDKDRDRDNRDRERDWQYQNHHINNNHSNHQQGNLVVNHLSHNSLTIAQDPGTSDDSGRASERLTTSSVAPRDADSSRDRLSDASSRCSSGKGYICDSEGDDDKGSDGGSVVFASTPTQVTTAAPSPAAPRKSDFPTTGLPLSNGPLGLGGSASPVPVPPGPGPAPPAPSPAPAALPPPSLPPPYPTPMQVSNGPISTHLTPISNPQQQQPPLAGKPMTGSSGKLPPVCAAAGGQAPPSAGKQPPQQVPSPQQPQTPQSPAAPSAPQAPASGKPLGCVGNLMGATAGAPLTTIANGYSSAIPPIATSTHPISTPRITSPGLATGQVVATGAQQPASLPVGVPQPPPATAPTAPPPATLPPGLDSAAAASGRTNSPAVATSAVLSAAAPAVNGNSSAVTSIVGTNSSIPSVYRSGYPNYPLYAPYSNLHHSPYLPPAVPSPTASPRTPGDVGRAPGRGESPLVMSAAAKPVRPVTPSSNGSASATSVGQHATTQHSATPLTVPRAHSPRGHSPTRERDSYSSNVSSLSRSSATPGSVPYNSGGSSSGVQPGPSPALSYNAPPGATQSPLPPSTIGVSSSLSYPKSTQSTWSSTQLSPATNTSLTRPTPPPVPVSIPSLHSSAATTPTHTFPPPLFAAPLPPPAVTTTTAAPHPFSAESLFQSKIPTCTPDRADQADLLRRELDNRFLDRSGLSAVPPSPYLRQELHHHQHQHTHLHQHQQIIASTPSAPAPLFPPPIFKDIPKMGAVDSPFYRTGLGMPTYPGYSPGLLHPGLSGPTPFVPPSHLPAFAPKKTGRWNAMHVRIAWEIYHHQTKQNPEKTAAAAAGLSAKATDLLRPPSHIFPPATALGRPHEMPTTTFPPTGLPGRTPFESVPLSTSFLTSPASHLGTAVSPFGRYASPFGGSPFAGLSPFSRDLPLGGPLTAVHDPWRSAIPRTIGAYPPAPGQSAWPLKPDPNIDAARREAEEREREMREREQRERERQRREREERERREREKEEKRKEQERERERERERREKERREMERREMERERLLQQQRLAESTKLANSGVQRDRSPLRNGTDVDVRVKEEPRKEDTDLLMRTDPRYHPVAAAVHHPYLAVRHAPHVLAPPPPHLTRSILPPSLGAPPMSHFPPPPPGPTWAAIDPYRDPYRLDSMLRYNPLMEAFRVEEERAKAMNAYAAHSAAHLRAKEPSPVPPPPSSHHRLPPGALKPPSGTHMPPSAHPLAAEMHKKDDGTQPR